MKAYGKNSKGLKLVSAILAVLLVIVGIPTAVVAATDAPRGALAQSDHTMVYFQTSKTDFNGTPYIAVEPGQKEELEAQKQAMQLVKDSSDVYYYDAAAIQDMYLTYNIYRAQQTIFFLRDDNATDIDSFNESSNQLWGEAENDIYALLRNSETGKTTSIKMEECGRVDNSGNEHLFKVKLDVGEYDHISFYSGENRDMQSDEISIEKMGSYTLGIMDSHKLDRISENERDDYQYEQLFSEPQQMQTESQMLVKGTGTTDTVYSADYISFLINSVKILNNNNTEASSLHVNQQYKVVVDADCGIDGLTLTTTNSLIPSGAFYFKPTQVKKYEMIITVSNGADTVKYNTSLDVMEEITYPTASLTVNSDSTSGVVDVYVPGGEKKALKLKAELSGDFLYLGKEITDYVCVFEIDGKYYSTSNKEYTKELTGDESLRGNKTVKLRLSFSAGGRTIVSDVLATRTLNILVPQIELASTEQYFSTDTDVTVEVNDCDEYYYKIYNFDETPTTDLSEYTRVYPTDGSFNALMTVSDGKDKKLSVIGKYDGELLQKSFDLRVDTGKPEVKGVQAEPVGLANLSILDFGMFANGTVKITVEAADEKSGIENVLLYKQTGASEESVELLECSTSLTTKDNGLKATAEFEISKQMAEHICILVTDKAGNSSMFAVREVSRGGEVYKIENYIILETTSPEVSVALKDAPEFSTNNVTIYSDAYVDISISDIESGLSSYSVKINNEVVAQQSDISENQIIYKKALTVSTEGIAADSQGRYNISIEATDNAGNVCTSTSTTLYKDTQAPVITQYLLKSLDNTPITTENNLLPFGIVFNHDVELTITAVDNANTAGIKGISLSVTDNIEQVGEPVQEMVGDSVEYRVTYRIKVPFCNTIVADVVDNAGNKLTDVVPTGAKIEIEHDGTIIDNYTYTSDVDYSQFTIDLSSNCRARFNYSTESTSVYTDGIKKWYGDYPVINATAQEISNAGSVGIRETVVSVNGERVTAQPQRETVNGVTHKETYLLDTYAMFSDSLANGDPVTSIKVEGNVTDNAGNESSSSYTVYVDTINPSISGFKFIPKNYSGEASASAVEKTDYGYFFKSDTTVHIYADDYFEKGSDRCSGIKSIYYELVPVNGKKTEGKVDAGEASIDVPSGFKGQINAYAVDNVNRRSKVSHPEGVIIENEKLHSETSSVSITPENTTLKDSSGNKLYNDDVEVELVVKDSFSGIKSVQYSVSSPYDTGKNFTNTLTVNNKSLSDSSWTVAKTDMNLVTEVKKTLTVKNNSNDVVITVILTDNAGNTTKKSLKISIDKTAPVLSLSYSGASAYSGDFYNGARTLTVTVRERNLTLANINSYVSSAINASNGGAVPSISWSYSKDKNNPDNSTFIGKAYFNTDGKYSVSLKVKDMAGNISKTQGGQEFVIDKSAPVITISELERYNRTSPAVTITIREANFNAASAASAVTVTASNGGVAPHFGNWTASGSNTYTSTAVFSTDGDYTISVRYTDKSGNSATASQTLFTVDTKAPVVKVVGLDNKKAYTEDVISFYIDVTDANLSSADVKLMGVCRTDNGYTNENVSYSSTEKISGGTRYIWSNIKTDGDGIYTLSCVATDKAGNKTTALRERAGQEDNNNQIVFSVNRHGSTYEIDDSSKVFMGSWTTTSKDVVFSEINADPINVEEVVVKLTNKSTEEEIILKQGEDFKLEVVNSDGSWYEYRYTIFSANFTGDGYYDIEVTSVDSTSKVTSSKNNAYGETLISYGIDTHAPNIDISGIGNGPYDSITRNAVVTVTDISLNSVVVKLNGEVVDEWMANSPGETYSGTITINESAALQTLSVEARDAADNANASEQDVFVSSNSFSIFFYRVQTLFADNLVLIISIAAVLAAAITALVVYKKKKGNRASTKQK